MWCPSIRLVPTSAPAIRRALNPAYAVSVDQVGADVGTLIIKISFQAEPRVRRSGWCRRRHQKTRQIPLPPILCPSIRLVPTSAPPPRPGLSRRRRCVRRSGWCRRRHRDIYYDGTHLYLCPSIRLVPTSAPTDQHCGICFDHVSVDQVGADVGTPVPVSIPRLALVSVDQVGADVGTLLELPESTE